MRRLLVTFFGVGYGPVASGTYASLAAAAVYAVLRWVLASAFFLFRFFDIAKLAPANHLERLPGGWGILCDDLAAGIQTNIVLQVVFRFLVVS